MDIEELEKKRAQRVVDVIKIKRAYDEVGESLRIVGKLLRTTEAGKYMWSSDHKSAVTGLRIIVETLRREVPSYTNNA